MPTIICPACGTENRPAGLSSLVCERCGRSIDPRHEGGSAEQFVRRQRRLRKKLGLPSLGRDETDELMAWILELPPEDMEFDEVGDGNATNGAGRASRLADIKHRLSASRARRRPAVLYSDPIVRMLEDELVINRYYWPLGRKQIPYTEIEDFDVRPLKAWHGQFRVHGIDHLGRWYSRDRHRGEKERAIDLTVGRLIRPVLTPEDVDAVLGILERRAHNVPD